MHYVYVGFASSKASGDHAWRVRVYECQNGSAMRLSEWENKNLALEAARETGLPVRALLDCIVCNTMVGGMYMVHDHLWRKAGFSRGHAHLQCLQSRIGRPLFMEDFIDVPVNDVIKFAFNMGRRYVEFPSDSSNPPDLP